MRARPLDWIMRGSLRTRIGAGLALLVFLLAGLLGGGIGRISEHQSRGRIGQSLEVDAQRLAERINGEMAERVRELSLLASIDALRELPTTVAHVPGLGTAPALGTALARTQVLIDDLKASFPYYTWIAVASPTGRVLAATDPTSLGSDISTRSAFRDGLRGPGVGAISQPVWDPRVLDLVQPIRDGDGNVVGMLAAQLAWNWLRDMAQSVVTADDDGVARREAFIVSSQDSVLMGPQGSVGQVLSLSAIPRSRAGFYGWSVEQWPAVGEAGADAYLTGVGFVGGIGPAPAPGSQPMRWTVLVRELEASAFAPAIILRETIWAAGLVLAALFAIAGWLLAGTATAPLARIAVAAERLRLGDDVQIPRLTGPREIESLSSSLRALVAALTRKQLALDEMQALALRDPLTGLLNRHGLRVRLDMALREATRTRNSLLVFVGDLDGFKNVNDTWGHATGDLLLCQVAARLTGAVRADDIVARLGGDEFMLALPAPEGGEDPRAIAVARRAQAAIAAPYELAGREVRVGCSLGGACWPEDLALSAAQNTLEEQIDEVIARADAALYAVKRAGKGQLWLHGRVVGLH